MVKKPDTCLDIILAPLIEVQGQLDRRLLGDPL